MALQITVECDQSDFDWLRAKLVPLVEGEVDEQLDRLDHPEKVEVTWEDVD